MLLWNVKTASAQSTIQLEEQDENQHITETDILTALQTTPLKYLDPFLHFTVG